MLTDFLRDQIFNVMWLALMSTIWFGWSQEDPPRRLRVWLIIGSVVGLLLALTFGFLVYRNWSAPSALEGRYHLFGILVGVEFGAAGIGCGILAALRRQRWMAWWVALVVALHFLPLATLVQDVSVAALGVLQTIALVGLLPVIRRRPDQPSSRLAGPVMGFSLLAFSILAAISLLVRGQL